MRYALLLYAEPGADRDDQGAPPDGVHRNWVSYTQSMKDAGVVVAAERLRPVDTATSVRWRGGERLLTDGPFIETKEHLLGFYLVDVADLDAALDWAARMPLTRFGTVEVRPVHEGDAWRAVLD
jgi:hypothetical protein